MRITNTMMTNSILHSINKNRELLSTYEQQIATGKKIQKPSDDPVVAIRALRLRTNVKEIIQYQTNAKDAISWAGVTEQSISNVTDIMKRIRELSVQATSDVMNIENRKNVVTEIDQLMEQFMSETNTTYAGRQVFGGYKTNVPLIAKETITDTYEITEHFDKDSIESVKRVVNDVIIEVDRIRLGYTGVANPDPTTLTSLPAFSAMNTMDSTDPLALTPAVGEVNFLQDTGELIFNHDDLANIPDPLDFTYEKSNIKKGELVPDHYFDCINTTTSRIFTVDREDMVYKISYSQEIAVNTMGYEVVDVDMARDMEELINTTKEIAADSSLTSALEEDILGDMFSELIGKMDKHISKLLNTRAGIGGKINRLELTIERLSSDELNFTDLLSQNEDIDLARVITKLSSQETVYNASLMASAKIIQPSLLDFIR